eukprot:767636-Hanusia_phi.AAC.8
MATMSMEIRAVSVDHDDDVVDDALLWLICADPDLILLITYLALAGLFSLRTLQSSSRRHLFLSFQLLLALAPCTARPA